MNSSSSLKAESSPRVGLQAQTIVQSPPLAQGQAKPGRLSLPEVSQAFNTWPAALGTRAQRSLGNVGALRHRKQLRRASFSRQPQLRCLPALSKESDSFLTLAHRQSSPGRVRFNSPPVNSCHWISKELLKPSRWWHLVCKALNCSNGLM